MGFEEVYVKEYFDYSPGSEEVLWVVKDMYETSPELEELFVHEFVSLEQGRVCYVNMTCNRIDDGTFSCRIERIYPWNNDEEVNDDNDWYFYKDFSSHVEEGVYSVGMCELIDEIADAWNHCFRQYLN